MNIKFRFSAVLIVISIMIFGQTKSLREVFLKADNEKNILQ